MARDLLVWLADLIRKAADPIRTAASGDVAEAIEIEASGRRWRIRVEEAA